MNLLAVLFMISVPAKKKKMSDDRAYHLPTGKGKGKGKKSACKVKLEGTNHHGDETVGVEEVKPIIKTEGPVSGKIEKNALFIELRGIMKGFCLPVC